MSRVAGCGVRAAGLAHVLLAHLVPHLLGVDDHAVQVEDDRFDHKREVRRGARRRATSRRCLPRSTRTSPTKNVWSPVRSSSTVRAVSQPGGAREQARVVLAQVDAVPEHDRRDAAREVLREVLLLAREQRRRPLARVAQQLVERRFERDRDADERRLERERDERRDRQPVPAPVDLRDDDRHPRRPAAEERALFGPAVLHGAEPSRVFERPA